MESTPESMRFIRYEVREGMTVAIFAPLDMPMPDWEWGEDGGEATETVFDRASLEARLANLRAAGYPSEVTEAALAAWPQAASRRPETPAEGRTPPQQKTAAVLRLLRGEDPEMAARALGIPAGTLIAWRDAFLAAGNSALES